MSSVYSEEEYKILVEQSRAPEIYLKHTRIDDGILRLAAYNIPMTEESRVILIQKINDIFNEYFSGQ